MRHILSHSVTFCHIAKCELSVGTVIAYAVGIVSVFAIEEAIVVVEFCFR